MAEDCGRNACSAGESLDWLDVHLRDGVEVVRKEISASVPFLPTPAELEELDQVKSHAAKLGEIATAYPLPTMDTLQLVYRYTASGRVKIHKMINSKEGRETGREKPVMVPIATPFGVSARLRYADQTDSYGLRCVVQDMNGKSRVVDFERAALAKMGAADIRAMLFAAGLRTEDDGEMIAVQCLKAADPEREIIIVRRPGWHQIAGLTESVFVTPSGLVIGALEGLHLELAAAARMASDVAQSGTLKGWSQAVEAAVTVYGCPHWTLGVLAGFTGPIVALTGLDTSGINFSGLSSSGKSTAQRLSASAWSTPDVRRPGLFQSARTTDNAVEALAERATGTVLVLDELAQVSGKAAAKMVYTIAGGVGKRRMTADAAVRPPYTWSTYVLLSGECSLEEMVRGDDGEWLAGTAVRIVDIDVTGVNRVVDPAILSNISQIEKHFGHAGPEFVKALVQHGLHRQAAALRDRVLKAARVLSGGDNVDSATVRAALPLALLIVAGELAKGFGLIPLATPVESAVTWGWNRFRQSSDAMALDPEARVLGSVREWIAERWGVTVKNVDANDGFNNRESIAWYDENIIYIPKTRLREAAGSGLRESQVASILDRRGMLAKRTEADRLYVRFIPKVGRIHAYALRRSDFGRSERSFDPDAQSGHEGGRSP
jgi:putative DNA primase/helicase